MLSLQKKRESGALLAGKAGRVEPTQLEPEEYDVKLRPDRVGQYFKKYAKDFSFDEFSGSFAEKAGVGFLEGIPVPLRKEDLDGFRSGKGVPMKVLAMNIAWIMGVNPKFQHIDQYLEFTRRHSGNKLVSTLVKRGRDFAEIEDYHTAAIYFRAALCVSPTNLHAMYSYARACRELYLAGGGEEYVGRFKAESIEFFELTTLLHPRHSLSHYYLGYCYLNMGLYVKAKLAWEQFLKMSANSKDRKEIRSRLEEIAQPVKIEEGCNAVLSGRYELGITILKPYLKTKFKDWWPMSYYLGVACARTGKQKEAADSFKRVLAVNPSHLESMEELADIYAAENNAELEAKYRKKAELVRSSKRQPAE
jgi:tetratricopeptide (TPR) repeat protein